MSHSICTDCTAHCFTGSTWCCSRILSEMQEMCSCKDILTNGTITTVTVWRQSFFLMIFGQFWLLFALLGKDLGMDKDGYWHWNKPLKRNPCWGRSMCVGLLVMDGNYSNMKSPPKCGWCVSNGEWLKMVLIDHLMDKMCTLAFCWILHWTWWVLRNDCWIFCLDLHRLSAKAVLSTLFATLGLANCLVRWKLKSPCVNFPHWWYKYLWLGHVQESMFLSISFEVLCGTQKNSSRTEKDRVLSFCFCPCRRC